MFVFWARASGAVILLIDPIVPPLMMPALVLPSLLAGPDVLSMIRFEAAELLLPMSVVTAAPLPPSESEPTVAPVAGMATLMLPERLTLKLATSVTALGKPAPPQLAALSHWYV